MLAEERFSEILKLVNEHKTITVQELTELLDMSESTIRRDLTTLHKKGKLILVTAINPTPAGSQYGAVHQRRICCSQTGSEH